MKKLLSTGILTVFILTACLASSLTVCASDEPMWSEEYYRAVAVNDGLTEAQQKDLDEVCLTFMNTWHVDLAMIAITSDRHEGESLSSYAQGYYLDAGFGYGPDKDGFQMVWDMDTDEVVIETFGAAQSMVTDDYLRFVRETIISYKDTYGVYGPMYATARFLDTYLKNHADKSGTGTGSETGSSPEADGGGQAGSGTPLDTIPDPSLRVGEGSDMPAWFPKDPDTFPAYLDDTAPRIVDTADLFTNEEESVMETRLKEIRSETEKDIVVFTDVSTYGLERKVYAADFYDFNGYGCGNDREGVCLFICMDPNARGGWTCCTGPETMGLYTETIANQIDDMLYDFLKAGEYYTGVSDWIENFRRLYVSGSPYTPDWALLSESTFTRFHNEDAPRITDDGFLLTEEETAMLEEQAAALKEQYGVDVVVHIARDPGNFDAQDFSDRYYYYNGYGVGSDYDGILLTIFKRPGSLADARISASGKAAGKLTEVNESRLRSRCKSMLSDGKIAEGIMAWMNQTGHMLKTGRAPRSALSWEITFFFELVIGLIFGAVSLARAKAKMAMPAEQTDADRYLVSGSLRIKKIADTFLNSVVTKTYSPEKTRESSDSSSSSSSGSSSYSSSYSGSSGTTHSGSGRDF